MVLPKVCEHVAQQFLCSEFHLPHSKAISYASWMMNDPPPPPPAAPAAAAAASSAIQQHSRHTRTCFWQCGRKGTAFLPLSYTVATVPGGYLKASQILRCSEFQHVKQATSHQTQRPECQTRPRRLHRPLRGKAKT